jgi:hypothetical protein
MSTESISVLVAALAVIIGAVASNEVRAWPSTVSWPLQRVRIRSRRGRPAPSGASQRRPTGRPV